MNSRKVYAAIVYCILLNIEQAAPQLLGLNLGLGGILNGGYDSGSRNSFQQYPNYQQYQQQPSSSNCDRFWSYGSDYYGQYGVIKITKPDYRTSVIRAILSIAAQLPSQNVGSLKLSKDTQSTVSDISQGLPLYYRVNFPITNPVPQIMEIYYNDKLLCSAPKVSGQFVTTITLDHNFYTGLTHPPFSYRDTEPWAGQQVPPELPPITQTEFTPDFTTRRNEITTTTQFSTTRRRTTKRQTTAATPTANYETDFECGVPDYTEPTTTGLVIRGFEVGRGQFPWLAALYYSPQNDESGFICGGSLLSKKLVVTAAHCIQRKEDNDASRVKAEEISFHLGKRNLQSLASEEGHVLSSVTEVFIHPDWSYKTQEYDADIAIAVLARTIVFNKFVKPICLWTTTQSFDDIVGQKGIVAGWGVDENKVVTTAKPKWARIPVVKSEVCLRSHSTFRALTSDRTFCAGENLSSRVGGSGPCNGDSGGGFIVKNGDKWYLRGIISAAIFDPETQTCNPENYSVFTDVTKFTSWMETYMKQFG